MFDRVRFKNEAKEFLRINYWKAFLVMLVVVILASSGNGPRTTLNYTMDLDVVKEATRNLGVDNFVRPRFNPWMLIPVAGFSFMALIIKTAISIIGSLTNVGGAKFFLEGMDGNTDVGYLGYGFNKDTFLNIFIVQFFVSIFIFLWSLLFIIPGIIKSYEYSMVKYILAEDPYLSSDQAIAISKDLTRGYKMDLFILDVSFWGWYILGFFLCELGGYFVNPYKAATDAAVYKYLKEKDLNKYDHIAADVHFYE